MRRLLSLSALALATLLSSISSSVIAQEFPSKPLTLIVPYSAGATLDIVGRTLGEEMSKTLGQPIVVENRPGADAQIGMEYLANRAEPDGYTFLIASVPGMAILPLTVKDLQFDPLADIPPFIGLVEGRYIFGSSASLPWKNMEELAAYGKANPGKLLYGASNPAVRFWSEELVRELGLEARLVPYKEGGVYIQAVRSGEVSMGFMSEGSAISLGEGFTALATTGDKRMESFGDAPTFKELGYPQMRGVSYALCLPKGTPQAVIDKLYEAASKALQQPSVQQAYDNIRLVPTLRTQDEIVKQLAEQHAIFSKLAEAGGVTPQ